MVHFQAGINEGRPRNVPSVACQLILKVLATKAFLIGAKGKYPMKRIALLAVPLVVVLAIPAEAHAQGSGQQCNPEQNQTRRNVARGIFGGLAGGMLGRVGGVAAAALPMASMLSDTLMNLLDCREQQKAASATEEAVRGGTVGTTVNWESESRPGVRGSSTVTAVENDASDGACMTVTDVVIVDGQETRAPKRMCRRPPSNRYVRV